MRKLLFVILIVLSALILVFLYSNKGRGSYLTQNPVTPNKLAISQKELDEAFRLEKFLNLNFFTADSVLKETASLSASPSPERAFNGFARERIVKRKILEAESDSLKVDLKKVKVTSEVNPIKFSPDSRVIPSELISTYSYDETLIKEFRRKLEGGVTLNYVEIHYNQTEFRPEAKKLAETLSASLLEHPDQNFEELVKKENTNSEITISAKSYSLVGKESESLPPTEELRRVRESLSGFFLSFNYLTAKDKGLGQDFDQWYQKVKVNYPVAD